MQREGLVLDAGAFIGLERRKQEAVALLERARGRSVPMVTSAAVVGQVWRGHSKQAPIATAFKWANLDIVDLTYKHGRLVGQLLAASGTSDIVDAHIVVLAHERGWPVVTSDPGDLRRLESKLVLHLI